MWFSCLILPGKWHFSPALLSHAVNIFKDCLNPFGDSFKDRNEWYGPIIHPILALCYTIYTWWFPRYSQGGFLRWSYPQSLLIVWNVQVSDQRFNLCFSDIKVLLSQLWWFALIMNCWQCIDSSGRLSSGIFCEGFTYFNHKGRKNPLSTGSTIPQIELWTV